MPRPDPDIERALNDPENRYLRWRQLEDGTYIATLDLMFTRALVLDVDVCGWSRRYCFEDRAQADAMFVACDSNEFEPWGWVARRPKRPEDYAP